MLLIMESQQMLHSANGTSFDLLFHASFSINACILSYFLLFYAATQLAVCWCQASSTSLAGKFRNAHKNKRQFMHNVYFDCFIHTTIMCATTVLILTTQSMNRPFETNSSYSLQVLYAYITGAYIFLFFKDVIITPHGPHKWMNLIIYGVTVATLATVVITKEDIVLVAIIVISNGDILNVNTARVMKKVLSLSGSSSYRIAIFMGTYATVVFRALLPIGLLVLALINGKPFNMSYASVFFFFVGLLFFGALNTWQVNAALARICRKGGRVVEVNSREVNALPKPEDRAIAEGIELPPTYDEVCGGLTTSINITEPHESSVRNLTNDLDDPKNEFTLSRSSSEESGLGTNSPALNISAPNMQRQDSQTSDYSNEGFTKDQADDFVEVDLGLGLPSVV